MTRADLVYTDEAGDVYAEALAPSGPLYAVPDGHGGVKWTAERGPLGKEGMPIMKLLGKALGWQ